MVFYNKNKLKHWFSSAAKFNLFYGLDFQTNEWTESGTSYQMNVYVQIGVDVDVDRIIILLIPIRIMRISKAKKWA